MNAYSIYISSTYRDLIEDRDLLRTRLDQAQYCTVCMEKYPPALSQIIKEKCQADVCKADIYVGIIGDNYGSIARDENGDELGFSYTEYEYDAAVASKRRRLIFFKTFKEPPKDERLIAFINKIKKSPLFTSSFEDIKDLPGLVLASIIAETGDFVKKIIPSETKYFCDRYDQADLFHSSLMKDLNDQIHFFMICGHKYNGHAMFVKRCMYTLSHMFGNQETLDIIIMANSNPPSDENKITEDLRKKVLRQLQQKTKEPVPDFSADCFFECLHKTNKHCLIISIVIQSSFLKNHTEVYKKAFQKFYTEFSETCNPIYKDKKILFFIHVQYIEEAGNEQEVVQNFESEPHFTEIRLPTLANISDPLITEWMMENNIEDNQADIDDRLKEFFSSIEKNPDGEYYMDNAEEAMDRVIDFYNQKKINS